MWLSQAIATPFDSTGQPAAGAAPAGAAPAGAAPAGAANASARPSPSPSIVGRESHAANVASSPQPAAREPQPNAASVADLVGPASAPIEVTESVALAPTTVVPLVVTPPHALDALALTAATPVVASDEPTSATTDPATAAVRTTINARSRRPRVRKVRRVVRSVDAWSVFKVSLIFYALVYVVVLVAGVLLWNLAISTGTVANIEGLVKELFGLDKFTIDGAQLYRASWALGAFLAIGGTGLNVVAAVLFNLITDLVGGVRLTVLEEEVRADLPRRRRFRKAGTPDSVDGAASGSGIVSPP